MSPNRREKQRKSDKGLSLSKRYVFKTQGEILQVFP